MTAVDNAIRLLQLLQGVIDAGAWDPDTQTWSGGEPATTFASRTVGFTFAGSYAALIQDAFPFLYSSLGQWTETVTSPPVHIAALGAIAQSLQMGVEGIDTTHDGFDLQSFVIVTNTAGTQVATLSADGFIPESGPDQSGSIDFSTGGFTNVVGSDITWDGSAFYTTAGGVFVVQMVADVTWD